MRVTGGSGKGRRLNVPAGQRIRPTSDKVKQALFNILGDRIEGALFLDLFAGTGGIGIEALSRGASRVVLVDDSRNSLQVIRKNIEQTDFNDQAQVVASHAEQFLKRSAEQFDIIFLDPPYTHEQGALLHAVAESAVLKPDSIVVSEHFKKQPSPEQAGRLALFRVTQYGDTVLAFYTLQPV